MVARSKTLDANSFETEPRDVFSTNGHAPDSYIQKQGSGALVSTPKGEWYYAWLCARPWNRAGESAYDPRGWSTWPGNVLSRKYFGDEEGWPRIEGGHGGKTFVEGSVDAIYTESAKDPIASMTSLKPQRSIPTGIRCPCPVQRKMGTTGNGKLTQLGKVRCGANDHDLSLIARRWQAFIFDAC